METQEKRGPLSEPFPTFAHHAKAVELARKIIELTAETFEAEPEIVCEKFPKNPATLPGNVRTARHAATALIKEFTKLPWEKIGNLTGKRNHSSAIYSFDRADCEYKTKPEFREKYDALRRRVWKLDFSGESKTSRPILTAYAN